MEHMQNWINIAVINIKMSLSRLKIVFSVWLILAMTVPFSASQAAVFDNGYIIGDGDLVDYASMTTEEIELFLREKSGKLAERLLADKNGNIKTAAQIIYEAAQEHLINPKFLLVMLQKEQSLIEDSTPSQKQLDWAMGYGVCDRCDPDDASLLLFKGFGVQVDRAAGVQRWYLDNKNLSWLKQMGKTYTIDGHKVTIANQVTANLYNYTPHIQGNYNFWKIWNGWFSQKYPDGTLLQAEKEPGVWLIENGIRRPFYSKSALVSRFDLKKIILVSRNELEKYESGAPIKYANYTVLTGPDKSVYLLVNNTLRKFESQEVLRTIGYNPEEFQALAESEMKYYNVGEPITMASAYPTGALLQDKKTGGVFFVQDGKKAPLITKDIMNVNFQRFTVTPVSPEELDKFETIDSVKLRDGEIVKTKESSSVYIISNGLKMPVSSGDDYEKLGYKWENLIVVDEKTLSNIPMGNYLNLDFKKAN